MSNQAIDLKNEAFRLAERGQHKKAFTLIQNFQPQSDVEGRILAHSEAEILMLLGRFSEALGLLLQAKETYGEHVALLTDIAICYYSLNDFKNWKFAFEDMKVSYETHKDYLVFERRAMAELNLAKFLEEDGEVSMAANMYLSLMRKMEERQDIARFYRVMSQAIRVMSSFRMSGSLASTYQRMVTIGKATINLHASIDVQHALLLSELTLMGPENAAARLLALLRTDSISLYDKQLIYFDYLEECLVQGFSISKKLIPFLSLFKELNYFEREIYKIVIKKDETVDFERLVELSQSIPLSSYIRVLGAYLTKTKDPQVANELRNQMRIITSSLSQDSQNLWISRYKTQLVSPTETVLVYDSTKKNISFGNKIENLARRDAFVVLVQLLSRGHEVETEKAVACIWNTTFDQSYYRSLRMTVHRLNKAIFELTGIPKVLQINKQYISCNGDIQFKVV
ncbi:MAG: hypothetical protein A4S09_16155 [Proteobacteria bacterium SG_bin7]|nr:MAG: hypothetical protein A4S09_16155 [Proteobacteria bacterium SG_bin7]